MTPSVKAEPSAFAPFLGAEDERFHIIVKCAFAFAFAFEVAFAYAFAFAFAGTELLVSAFSAHHAGSVKAAGLVPDADHSLALFRCTCMVHADAPRRFTTMNLKLKLMLLFL